MQVAGPPSIQLAQSETTGGGRLAAQGTTGHGLWDPEPSSNAGVSGGSGGSGPAEGEDSPGCWDGRTQGKGTSVGRCPSRYPAQGVSCLHWDSERNTIGAKFYELIEE